MNSKIDISPANAFSPINLAPVGQKSGINVISPKESNIAQESGHYSLIASVRIGKESKIS